MEYEFRVTNETAHLICGVTYERESQDHPWRERDGEGNGGTVKPKIGPWFEGTPIEILHRIGVTCTDAKRAQDFANLFEGSLAGYYYIAEAASEGSEEALKWVLGALATHINEKGLTGRDIPRILPADYLKAFCEALESGKIQRSFAKEIFGELLNAERHAPYWGYYHVDARGIFYNVADMTWERYEQLADSGELHLVDYEWYHVVRRAGVSEMRATYPEAEIARGSTRISADDHVAALVSDPRFKAADESEIDGLIAQVIAENAKEAEAARANPRAIQALMGKVMKASKGKASPQIVQAKLKSIFDPN